MMAVFAAGLRALGIKIVRDPASCHLKSVQLSVRSARWPAVTITVADEAKHGHTIALTVM